MPDSKKSKTRARTPLARSSARAGPSADPKRRARDSRATGTRAHLPKNGVVLPRAGEREERARDQQPTTQTKKKSPVASIPKYEKDPRWPRFVQKLMELQNAREAARQAGYTESTAISCSPAMARRCLEGLKAALWRKGMAVDRMADKLVSLFDAEEPRWNVKAKKWDYFQNTGAQLAAFDRIKTVLEPEPPKKLEVDVLIGVKRDESRDKETPEEWEARNEGRRKAATKVGQALLSTGVAQSEKGETGSGRNGGPNGSPHS